MLVCFININDGLSLSKNRKNFLTVKLLSFTVSLVILTELNEYSKCKSSSSGNTLRFSDVKHY